MEIRNGRRLLVVEDDLDTQANLRDILELDGYQVDVAGSFAEALRVPDGASLFAVILDRRLPDGMADSLLPQLREFAPRASVIVVTGYADLDAVIRALRHGVADFIPKPIRPELLRVSLGRIAALRAAEERALQAERLAILGQTMASVAHESRNALQRIHANVEMLRLSQQDPEDVRLLDRIDDAARTLHLLLEEIREFAVPVQLSRHEWNLCDVWRKAWADLEHDRKGRTFALQECINSTDLQFLLDVKRFEQVFRNLFANSLAACGETGRIEISCSDEQLGEVEVISLLVRDNGPGLSDAQRQQIFEPFYTTKPHGTGLGMAIVKRLIEAHGGKIEIADSNSSGAAFMIRLPRSRP